MATEKIIKVTAKTEDAVKNVEKLNKKTEETGKQAKKTEGDFSGLGNQVDKMTGGAVSGFKGVLGSIKGVTTGLKTMRGALIATGLGALVVVLGSIIAAFQGSEEGQNKFNKILGVTGAIVGNVVDLFADLGDTIINAVQRPREAWDNFVNFLERSVSFVRTAFINPFVASFENLVLRFLAQTTKARIAWNNFVGDHEQAEQLKTELDTINAKIDENIETIAKGGKAIVDMYNNAKDAVKGFINEQIEEGNQAAKVADMRAKADKIERGLLTRRATLENEIAQRRLKARQEEEFSAEERKRFLLEAQELEDELLQKETQALKLRADAQSLENTFARSNKQNLDDEARLKAAVIQQEVKRTNAARQVQNELNRINRELASDEKARLDEIEKARAEADKRRIEQAKERQSLLEKFRIENQEEQLAREEQEALAEIQRLEGTEAEKARIIEFYANKRSEIEQKNVQEQIRQQEILKQQSIALTAGTFGEIANILGEESKAGKAFAIGQALINTYQGISAAVASSPFPANVPGIAFASATGFGAVKNIMSTNTKSPSGGGGATTTAPSRQVQAPSFNIVGDSGTNQLADVIGKQSQTPIKTFVVSGEVSSQMELDRKIQEGASLG